MALPVRIEVIILSPSSPFKEELAFTTNKLTRELFTNSKNLTNSGAKAIARPPQK